MAASRENAIRLRMDEKWKEKRSFCGKAPGKFYRFFKTEIYPVKTISKTWWFIFPFGSFFFFFWVSLVKWFILLFGSIHPASHCVLPRSAKFIYLFMLFFAKRFSIN